MVTKRPVFVIVPGASQNPAHYGYLSHLLQLKGYPVFSALVPSVGAADEITVEDDTSYIRDKMLLPVLDHEEQNVIMLMHSYSSVPGSAAATGLGKAHIAQGKKTSIIGQIYLSALLTKGGDGNNVLGAFGGQYPPHIRADDVSKELADVVAVSAMAQGMTSFTSSCPRASWDSEEYKGRVAFVRTLKDAAIPLHIQQMMLDGTQTEWIVKDIDTGHSPQLSQPEKLTELLVGIANEFEKL